VIPIWILGWSISTWAQTEVLKADWEGGYPDGCTSITVGRKASTDGSVMTSHTCDSHRTRSWLDIRESVDYPVEAMTELMKRVPYDSLAMPTYTHVKVGEIPQVPHTYGYINTAYPCMNTQQLAIGESTFGGRESLHEPDLNLIDCQQLVKLMQERCRTAREAIALAGELLASYGWSDEGECLTIADPQEVWHFEVVGPGKGQRGAIWVAQRVPDEHISVNANGSRIRQIDLNMPDYFRASANVFRVAQDSGWWNPANGPFEFCYSYAPESRVSYAARRREWRVFDLVAPSLGLHPDSENYPFSVKPDSLIDVSRMMALFQDWYQGTDYDLARNITWLNPETQEYEISPLANPFMPYDMLPLFKINGGWGWRGERQIARWYTMYATITQSRDWLPADIGGVVWLAFDNVATSIYVPLYCSISDVAPSYKVPGRVKGYNRESAWWAFNRLGTLTAQRWGDMHKDIQTVWKPLQEELLKQQPVLERQALEAYKTDPTEARRILNDYGIQWGSRVVAKAWELGDWLWTKYDEKF
jgi:dipeptidase